MRTPPTMTPNQICIDKTKHKYHLGGFETELKEMANVISIYLELSIYEILKFWKSLLMHLASRFFHYNDVGDLYFLAIFWVYKTNKKQERYDISKFSRFHKLTAPFKEEQGRQGFKQ